MTSSAKSGSGQLPTLEQLMRGDREASMYYGSGVERLLHGLARGEQLPQRKDDCDNEETKGAP